MTRVENIMENLIHPRRTIVSLVIALVAAFFGFTGIQGYSWTGRGP